jgi:ATP synthase F1 epsilon subunit
MAKLHVEIVTGERVVFTEDDVDMVVAPGIDGTLGILPKHAPLVTILSAGAMRVKKGGAEQELLVFGGFMEVANNRVIVLADTAERAEEIDVARAEEARHRARARSPTANRRLTWSRRARPCGGRTCAADRAKAGRAAGADDGAGWPIGQGASTCFPRGARRAPRVDRGGGGVTATSTQQASAAASNGLAGDRSIRVTGGVPLHGTVAVGGSKNLALPALAAALLTDEPCVFDNVPLIDDTRTMLRLLKALGAAVAPDPDGATYEEDLATHRRVTVRAAAISRTDAPPDLAKSMRASFLVVGPLLARCGRAAAPPPGGDAIGARPLDVAIHSFKRMGATVVEHTNEQVSLVADRCREPRFTWTTPATPGPRTC